MHLPYAAPEWPAPLGTWEIVEDRLLRTGIERLVRDAAGAVQEASLANCFSWRPSPIWARWVDGSLSCPEGRLRAYRHMSFDSGYERDRFFLFRHGVLEEEWLRLTAPAPLCYQWRPSSGMTQHLAL